FGTRDIHAGGLLDVASLDGSSGFVIDPTDAGNPLYPALRAGDVNRAGAVDVNGDGTDDLLLCTHQFDFHGYDFAGLVYVLYGGPSLGRSGRLNLATIDPGEGFVIVGPNSYQ